MIHTEEDLLEEEGEEVEEEGEEEGTLEEQKVVTVDQVPAKEPAPAPQETQLDK